MRSGRWIVMVLTTALAACAVAARSSETDVRLPLGAMLLPGASTGAPVPLRFDPNAKVVRSRAGSLPAASYLPSQAVRGRRIFEQSCAACHEQGQFVGQAFVESWNDRRIADLYGLIRSSMPLDNPGGMKDGEYLDVVAYLLQANRHATTRVDSLRADTLSLRGTRIAVSAP